MIRTSEILFVKCVKDGIPNRDPLADSDARRLFGEDDGRISLSDVSIKRDVRDYVLAKYPEGGEDQRHHIYIQELRRDKFLLGRKELAQWIFDRAGIANELGDSLEQRRAALARHAYDVRTFGAVYSVGDQSFHLTGPTQFGWAHSLHAVETRYVQGTVVIPSAESQGRSAGSGSREGKQQGTIWSTYYLPFAVFAMPGIVNATIAQQTGMDASDVELLLEALWRGTKFRQARGRGFQQPLLLIHVEYQDPLFRLGYLEEGIRLETTQPIPTGLDQVQLDVRALSDRLAANAAHIARVRWWQDPELEVVGELPGVAGGLEGPSA
ncbi:MAG: type I CRISPR-associated protein Cas7 [Firmicutes bacterium]|nr:type I CRISPR-associated protein Cas7 [Alicyclobacillaceae bacterium]MCL6498045.1 type I CRISPR-associated protein Cas7 [Bacillota bacterium]